MKTLSGQQQWLLGQVLTASLCLSAPTPLFAESYSAELDVKYSNVDESDLDVDRYSVTARYYFHGVKSGITPLAEAAFLSRRSSVGAAYSDENNSYYTLAGMSFPPGYTVPDYPDTKLSIKNTTLYAEYIDQNSGWLGGASSFSQDAESRVLSSGRDIDTDLYSAWIGKYLGSRTRVTASYSKGDRSSISFSSVPTVPVFFTPGDEIIDPCSAGISCVQQDRSRLKVDITTFKVSVKHLGTLADMNYSVGMDIASTTYERKYSFPNGCIGICPVFPETFQIEEDEESGNIYANWYIKKNLDLGLSMGMVNRDTFLNDVKRYEASLRWFIDEGTSVRASYQYIDPERSLNELEWLVLDNFSELSLALTMRF